MMVLLSISCIQIYKKGKFCLYYQTTNRILYYLNTIMFHWLKLNKQISIAGIDWYLTNWFLYKNCWKISCKHRNFTKARTLIHINNILKEIQHQGLCNYPIIYCRMSEPCLRLNLFSMRDRLLNHYQLYRNLRFYSKIFWCKLLM